MGDRVIEPSEIIIGGGEPFRPPASRVNPWLRCIARFFDYSLFFFLIHLISYPISLPLHRLLPIEFFAWIPVETLLLASWGTTPGKWLLKTEIKKGHLRRFPFSLALRRSFSVWFRGIGMGIPVINVLCLVSAYYRLKMFQTTSWDRDEGLTVIHHPLPKWRFYLVTGLTIAGMILYSFWKKPIL